MAKGIVWVCPVCDYLIGDEIYQLIIGDAREFDQLCECCEQVPWIDYVRIDEMEELWQSQPQEA